MKTDLEQLVFCTLNEAQNLLNANDPGYTIVLNEESNDVSRAYNVLNPSGVVVAVISEYGITKKALL